MRWYVNDASLQGQFADASKFEPFLRQLVAVRMKSATLFKDLYAVRGLPEQAVCEGTTFRDVVSQLRDKDLTRAILTWLDRNGPFVDDHRLPEDDDYFEYFDCDVTDTGLGEASRRIKAGQRSATLSFPGGSVDFARSPLLVDHGLPDARLGTYAVENYWDIDSLYEAVRTAATPVTSWTSLVEVARERCQHLTIANLHQNRMLAREAFNRVIAERAVVLLGYLDSYMSGRCMDGSEGPVAREIVQKYFVGERALFSPESPSNQRLFQQDLTFPDPDDASLQIFAHWHGKISHRAFRLHFEWPVPADQRKLKVVYIGPKITRN